jgi:hypothetical protein
MSNGTVIVVVESPSVMPLTVMGNEEGIAIALEASSPVPLSVCADEAPVTIVIPRGAPGEQGIQGIQGIPGSGASISALTFEFTQGTPSALWTVVHNLGFYPNIQVFDSAHDEVEGDVVHVSINELTITFSAAFSGVAIIN